MKKMSNMLDDQSGQLMILGAFIIAVGIVSLTVTFNSVMVQNNMAVEDDVPSKNEFGNLVQIIREETRSMYGEGNNNWKNVSSNLSKIYSLHGQAVNIGWNNELGGAMFTDNGVSNGRVNWSVVENVNVGKLDAFKFWNMTIVKSFKVDARNTSGYSIWSIEFNSTHYNVTNLTGSSSGTIISGAEINLNDSQYYLKDSVSVPISIYIINGNNVFGRFKIQGLNNNGKFYRERQYITNVSVKFSTDRIRANITLPVTLPG